MKTWSCSIALFLINCSYINILVYFPKLRSYQLVIYLLTFVSFLPTASASSKHQSSSNSLQSITRKFYSTSRPKSLTVTGRKKISKSSSEPMNLQTDISPGTIDIVTGSMNGFLVFGSPQHKVLKVSFCDHILSILHQYVFVSVHLWVSMSVVNFFFKQLLSESNLMEIPDMFIAWISSKIFQIGLLHWTSRSEGLKMKCLKIFFSESVSPRT